MRRKASEANNSGSESQKALNTSIIKAEDTLTVLRMETALSRFPLHRIAKKSGEIAIEIHDQVAAVQWSVSHNTKYGQPGPLAYRLDTLLVNRRIEEAGKPIPRLIRLGSLPEIATELGFTGHNWNLLRRALHQNASAYITAKLNYRANDRSERFLEAGFHRYSVIFTGEKLPSGEAANAVYLVLSDIFLDVLNTAMWRPLDYDYMKTLPPGSQRFYEIVSYQVYAALQFGNPRAKFAYSEYCLLSTATRYFDFEHVKKQMYKILRPHIQSGYLTKIEYEGTVNEQGEADWMMYLTPGPNASREYLAFTGQGKTRKPKAVKAKVSTSKKSEQELTLPFPEMSQESPADSGGISVGGTVTFLGAIADAAEATETESAEQKLIQALREAELNRSDAERFAREKPAECRRQLEFLPHVREFKTGRGAYLRRAIEEDYGPPKGYAQEQTRQASLETARRKRGAAALQAAEIVARQSHEERCSEPYLNYLRERVGEAQRTQPEAFQSFEQGEAAQRATLTSGPFAGRPLQQKALEVFDGEAMRMERARDFFHARGFSILNFWEWDAAHNPKPFQF